MTKISKFVVTVALALLLWRRNLDAIQNTTVNSVEQIGNYTPEGGEHLTSSAFIHPLLSVSSNTTTVERESATNRNYWMTVNLHDCQKGESNYLAQEWCMDDTHTARYIGSYQDETRNHGASTMHYYLTHDGALQCLTNTSILLIGDSRVRYQYLTLVDFLTRGRWMKCRDYSSLSANITTTPESCSLIDHEPPIWRKQGKAGYRAWNRWFRRSNTMLRTNVSRELCDCWRDMPFREETTTENRYYQRLTPSGWLTVTYIQSYSNLVRIHDEFPPNSGSAPRCIPGGCTHDFHYAKSVLETIGAFLNSTEHRPTHVFAQLGWDKEHKGTPAFLEELRKLQETTRNVSFHFVTHPRSPWKVEVDSLTSGRILDRYSPTKNVPMAWYYDGAHALSIPNVEFNNRLLNLICRDLLPHVAIAD